jgi:chromosome condensin MukBEF complex kleisin-like MukF subunit
LNANELADVIDKMADAAELQTSHSHAEWHRNIATMLRQQQAEIEALKKTCLDEITKRVYADQTTKVIEGYWEEAQAEIEAKELYINRLHKLCNENGLGVGKNLLTGEVIPFEVKND